VPPALFGFCNISKTVIWKINDCEVSKYRHEKMESYTLKHKDFPCLALVSMGCLDLLTTLIGILYFGATELNPWFAEMTETNLPAYTVIRLSLAVSPAVLFFQIEKIFEKTQAEKARLLINCAYFISIVALAAIVANNIVVMANAV
jgi:hypothetical protein